MAYRACVVTTLVACKELCDAFLADAWPTRFSDRPDSQRGSRRSRGMSDFGSRMGAAGLGQAASDTVIVTTRRAPTWAQVAVQADWLMARSVRIEATRESIRYHAHAPFEATPAGPGVAVAGQAAALPVYFLFLELLCTLSSMRPVSHPKEDGPHPRKPTRRMLPTSTSCRTLQGGQPLLELQGLRDDERGTLARSSGHEACIPVSPCCVRRAAPSSGYGLGSDRGSPKDGRTLFSKRVMAQI
jgi:hypothetical protein